MRRAGLVILLVLAVSAYFGARDRREPSATEPAPAVEGAQPPLAWTLDEDPLLRRGSAGPARSEVVEDVGDPLDWGSRFGYRYLPEDDPSLKIHSFLDSVVGASVGLSVEMLEAEAEKGDGEAAFGLYAILNTCEYVAPYSLTEVAWREEWYIKRLVEEPERDEGWWETVLAGSEVLFETCRRWDRAELRSAAWSWLSRSAELGYFPGVLTYVYAGEFLVGRLALWGETGRIESYRASLHDYWRRLLETGRPEVFAMLAMHHHVGTFAPPEPVLAVAYLEAAVLAANAEGYSNRTLADWRLSLTRPERQRAEELGREICRRYTEQAC